MGWLVFTDCLITPSEDHASDTTAPYDLVIRGGVVVGRNLIGDC